MSSKKQKQNIRKIVRKEIKSSAEEKFIDVNLATLTINATAVLTDLFLPLEGPGRENRIGDVCSYKSIEFAYSLQPISAVNAQMVRVMLIQWKPDSASNAIGIDQILTDTAVNKILSHHQHALRTQYNVLYDVVHTLGVVTPEAESRRVYRRVVRIPPTKKVYFNRSATTGKNKVYLLTVSDITPAAPGNIDVNCRIKFVDL